VDYANTRLSVRIGPIDYIGAWVVTTMPRTLTQEETHMSGVDLRFTREQLHYNVSLMTIIDKETKNMTHAEIAHLRPICQNNDHGCSAPMAIVRTCWGYKPADEAKPLTEIARTAEQQNIRNYKRMYNAAVARADSEQAKKDTLIDENLELKAQVATLRMKLEITGGHDYVKAALRLEAEVATLKEKLEEAEA